MVLLNKHFWKIWGGLAGRERGVRGVRGQQRRVGLGPLERRDAGVPASKLRCDNGETQQGICYLGVYLQRRVQPIHRGEQGGQRACKAAGALVTENDHLWRVVHALAGKNYKIPGSSNLQHFLLKQLLIEKSIDAVAPSSEFVRELEETCINEPDLRFNIPKNMEESKVKFEHKPTFTAQSKRKQEQQGEGHGEQDAFGKADVGDPRLRWYTVTELNKFICELCAEEMQMNKVEGARTELEVQSLFLRELLRELERGHERYCKVYRGGENVHAPLCGMRGGNLRPSKPHGGRQQHPGHDHTGARVF